MSSPNMKGGGVISITPSGEQPYIPPHRCFKIVNVPGGVDIGRDDDSVSYSHLCLELETLFTIYSR